MKKITIKIITIKIKNILEDNWYFFDRILILERRINLMEV